MCFHSQQTKGPKEVARRFQAVVPPTTEVTIPEINGFTFPKTPIISKEDPALVVNYQWGLIPRWANDKSIQKYTLNARVETLTEKPAFKGNVGNRCLVISDGFFEWQWLDSKGRRKQKYMLTSPHNALFAFAGIYDVWEDSETEEPLFTYTILTTEANALMEKVHNSKKRMPVIIPQSMELDWLNGLPLEEIAHFDTPLHATPITPPNETIPLFSTL